MRLSYKLVLIFLAAGLIAAPLLGAVSFLFFRESLRETDRENNQEYLRSTLGNIDQLIFEQAQSLRSVAVKNKMRELLSGTAASEQDRKKLTANLKEIALIYPYWGDITVLDKKGIIQSSSSEEMGISGERAPLAGIDSEYRSVFEQALTGKIAITDLYFSQELKAPTITLMVPIIDIGSPTKDILGVVETCLIWQKFSENLSETSLPLFLLNNRGIEIGSNISGREQLILSESGIADPEVEKAFKEAMNTGIGYQIGTEEMISVQRQAGFQYYSGSGWFLVSKESLAKINAAAKASSLKVLMFLFPILIILGAALLFFIRRSIIDPISAITHFIEKINQENLYSSLLFSAHGKNNEIGRLAKAFNQVSQKMHNYYESLEKKVAERTQSIEEKNKKLDEAQRAVINIMEDLAEEKNNIEEEKIKTEAMIESIGDGIVATDENGTIVRINGIGEKLLNVAEKEVIGKKVIDSFGIFNEKGEKIVGKKRPIYVALKDNKQVVNDKYFLKRKDETLFPVYLSANPVTLNGKIIGSICIYRDITREKEIDKAKTEFVSIASHQLRTPLTAIKWYTEMLLNEDAGQLTDQQKEYLNEVESSNDRMVELVGKLLNVSRIDLGTFSVEPVPTDLREVAKSVLSELKVGILGKKITVVEDYDPKLPLINLDPKLIRIVFQNLLSNAVKYNSDGGKLTVISRKKGSEVQVEIADTGYGIPEKDQPKMFTKLFRADNVRVKETEGNGLGLYIVKAIVEEAGGKIWFESQENKGTRFFFTLPLSGMVKREGIKQLG